MDIRQSVVGILCCGSPAPGINGVISAASTSLDLLAILYQLCDDVLRIALEAINNGYKVLGFLEGWKHLKLGVSKKVCELTVTDVTKLHNEPGSFLMSSKEQLSTSLEVDNCLRVIEHLRIEKIVSIGGIESAHSAYLLDQAVRANRVNLAICHVPKTIFNDLPLPIGSKTFGFSTATDYGVRLVRNLQVDAKSMARWYIIMCMGQRAGHLALEIGKAAAATMTLIPEEFPTGVSMNALVDVIEASIVKRLALGKPYGTVILTEALVNLMDPREVASVFGDVNKGHHQMGAELIHRLSARLQHLEVCFGTRHMGSELRAQPPNASDVNLSRDLGYGAVRYLISGASGAVVVLSGGNFTYMQLSDMIKPDGSFVLGLVDVTTKSYEVARSYQIRLERKDLDDGLLIKRMSDLLHCSTEELLGRYKNLLHA